MTCNRQKKTHKKAMQKLWTRKVEKGIMYPYVTERFSSQSQLVQFLENDDNPPDMNQVISIFTEHSGGLKDVAISADNIYLTYNDLLSIGTMKSMNSKSKSKQTTYRWMPLVGKPRMLNDQVMSYAASLLENGDTISIRHHCHLKELGDIVLRRHVLKIMESFLSDSFNYILI
jgi:hypothetical protein